MAGSLLLVLGVVVAFAGWTFLFRRPPEGIWPRTWMTAAALSSFSLVALALTDRLDDVVGPVSPLAVAAGVGIGGAWLVATHVGHVVLCRLFPNFLDQVTELYSLREGDRVTTMVGPVAAMGVAEELFFRGFVQGRLGLVGSVVAYTAVQLVAGKWALTLAGFLGGVVWGLLAWWTGGLVAPVLAHVLWTGTLTFVWPLRGCGHKVGAADSAPIAGRLGDDAGTDHGDDDGSPAPVVADGRRG
ncbi:MAG TPA: type II CAAX endopeptidase family protein [Aquihabitans sp.]|jgi:hypothetical protein|nr:type II CAAX endopeptidase family protein [Aquihabitans sp.]